MATRDVTELLRVDTAIADADGSARAVALIQAGLSATVASDRTAVKVLRDLGLSDAEARDQVRVSHGPMA